MNIDIMQEVLDNLDELCTYCRGYGTNEENDENYCPCCNGGRVPTEFGYDLLQFVKKYI